MCLHQQISVYHKSSTGPETKVSSYNSRSHAETDSLEGAFRVVSCFHKLLCGIQDWLKNFYMDSRNSLEAIYGLKAVSGAQI
jgi:hypothetical protein